MEIRSTGDGMMINPEDFYSKAHKIAEKMLRITDELEKNASNPSAVERSIEELNEQFAALNKLDLDPERAGFVRDTTVKWGLQGLINAVHLSPSYSDVVDLLPSCLARFKQDLHAFLKVA